MLKSLSIKNFRNFRSFRIGSLSRVNLVVGKNNVGKSNLLDAISIYAAAADLNWIAQILERRELLQKSVGKEHAYSFTKDGEDVYSSLFYRWNKSDSSDNKIIIEEDGELENTQNRHVALRLVRLVLADHLQPAKEFKYKILKEEEQSELPVFRGFQTFSPTHRYKMMIFAGEDYFLLPPEVDGYLKPFQYVSTRTRRIDESDESLLWGRISLTPLKSIVLDALKIVDPRIVDFNYLLSGRIRNFPIPYVRLENSEIPVPLGTLGDGVGRVLTVVLNLVGAQGGFLLIDELENGLHYTVQESLWQMIFQVAEKLDVQVFATTHSDDCLRAFNEILKNDAYSHCGQVISLAKVKGEIECSIYQARHLDEAVEQEMEVR